MKKRQLILGLVALVAMAALFAWGRERIHFNFGDFRNQLALADWRRLGAGIACIYLAYAIRSVRWAYLLRHNQKVAPFSLLGTQVIGFTAVALIGRVAGPGAALPCSEEDGAAAEQPDRGVHCGAAFRRRIDGADLFFGHPADRMVWPA